LRAEAGRDLRVRVRALTTLAGLTGSRLGNLPDAVRLQREAEASLEALGGSPLLLGKLLDNMAAVHFTHRDYGTGLRLSEQAMPLLQQSLGDDHLDVAIAWTNRGIALRGLGETRGAIEAQHRALGIKEHLFGPDHPSVATSLINLGEAHRSREEWAEAEVLMRRAIASRERFFGPTHTELGGPLINLALIELAQGRFQAVKAGLHRVEALFENRVAPDHPEYRALTQAWNELRRGRR
ncbi:MAG: tetratricopeptide repeat protein, partial [Archangium sp.]|nr:tetratricopeptide repeat protein [Archangium sp.]